MRFNWRISESLFFVNYLWEDFDREYDRRKADLNHWTLRTNCVQRVDDQVMLCLIITTINIARCLEIASPKKGKSHHPGLEHMEIVIGSPGDSMYHSRESLKCFQEGYPGKLASQMWNFTQFLSSTCRDWLRYESSGQSCKRWHQHFAVSRQISQVSHPSNLRGGRRRDKVWACWVYSSWVFFQLMKAC